MLPDKRRSSLNLSQQIPRALVCVGLGVIVAMMGTVIHRYDVLNLPVGILIALALTASAAVVSRAWVDMIGLGAYGLGWIVVAQLMALTGPGGDVLIPGTQAIGYVWLYGGLAVIAVSAFAPRKWFADTARTPTHDA